MLLGLGAARTTAAPPAAGGGHSPSVASASLADRLEAHRIIAQQESLTVAAPAGRSGPATGPRQPAAVLRWRRPELPSDRITGSELPALPAPRPHASSEDEDIDHFAGPASGGSDRRVIRVSAVLGDDPMELPVAPATGGPELIAADQRRDDPVPAATARAPVTRFEVVLDTPADVQPVQHQAAVDPEPLAQEPPRSVPPTTEPAAELPAPSSRIYNRRDCAKEGKECESVREAVKADVITRISLDITPSIKPDAKDPAEVAAQRDTMVQQMLQEDPNSRQRVWHSRAGGVVARGLLVDITNGRAIIQSPDGEKQHVAVRDLSDNDQCYLAAWWKVPTECRFVHESYEGRDWEPMTFTWKASALCHKPLYFEQVAMERYGHTPGPWVEPFTSCAHFFVNLAFLPYQMGMYPPTECQYALGYYRPGSCAPWFISPVPLSVRGGLWEAGAALGAVYIIP